MSAGKSVRIDMDVAISHIQSWSSRSCPQVCWKLSTILGQSRVLTVVCRSILVGGGGVQPVPKNRRCSVGGQKIFSKISEKNFVLSSKFLMTFLVIENCNKISTQQK